MIPFSLYIYNNRKEDTTYQTVASFIELEQDTIKTHRQINQLEKANDKDFDKDGVYDALLVEAGKVLMDWNSKLFNKDFYYYEEELALYDVYQQIEDLPRFIPIILTRDDELTIKRERALIMQQHHFPYLEEKYPTASIHYINQLSKIMFSFYTVVIIILVFGFNVYKVLSPQYDFILSTPIKRKKLVTIDFKLLVFSLLVVFAIFIFSSVVILSKQGWHYLHYPILLSSHLKFALLPAWELIVIRGVVWSGVVAGYSMLIQVIARFVKSPEVNFLILLIVSFGLQMVGNMKSWNPLSYIFDLEHQLLTVNRTFIVIFSLVILGIWIVYYHSDFMGSTYEQLRRGKVEAHNNNESQVYQIFYKCLGFEFIKRIRYRYVKRLLFGVFALLLASYAFIAFKTLYVEDEFKHHLNNQVDYYSGKVAEMQPKVDLIFLSTQQSFMPEFDKRLDTNQTFKEWYQQKDPTSYAAIQGLVGHFQENLDYYQATLNDVIEKEFGPEELIQYREYYFLQEANNRLITKSMPRKSILAAEAQNKIIKEKQLKPLLLGNLLLDSHIHSFDNYAEHRQWDHSTLYSLFIMSENHVHVLIVVILFIALFSSFAEEQTPNNTLNFQFSQPRRRISIYWDKHFYNFKVLLGSFLLYLFGVMFFSSLIGGWGQSEYPIVHYLSKMFGEQNPSTTLYSNPEKLFFEMRSLSKHLSQLLMILLVSIYFLSNLGLSLSVWINNRFVLMTTLISALIGGYYLSVKFIHLPIIKYFPFIYLNSQSLVDGWFSHLGNNDDYHYIFGSLVLIVWSLVILLIGVIKFNIRWGKDETLWK